MKLKALIVVGPIGPLWGYSVAVVLEDGEGVRVNSLAMPHARVTGKGTGLVSDADATRLLEDIERASLVRRGVPATAERDDFSYGMVLAQFGEGKPQYFYAAFDPMTASPHTSQLVDRVNALLSKTEATYRQGRAVPAPAAK